MQTELNTYKNVKTPAFTSSMSNIDWFSLIVNPNPEHLSIIEEARKLKQEYLKTGDKKKDDEYKEEKRKLPAVTWNATYSNNYKKDDNYKSGTGLIYIDVDHPDFNISMLDLALVYSYYKSVGGIGYGIICKVDGINPENYKPTFYSITDALNITEYIDPRAVKLSQYSILSYDVNLFLNPDSFVFTTVGDDLSNKIDFVPSTLIIKKTEHNKDTGYKTELQDVIEQNNIRYSNINDFDFNGEEYITDWVHRFDYIQCWIPFQLLTDGRKCIMMNYIRNLVWLNPNIEMKLLINTSMFINKKICETPLDYKKIKEFIDLCIKQKNAGTLTPKVTKKIILFNPCLHLSTTKLKLWGKARSFQYKEIGMVRLYNIIEDWKFEFNGKLTIRSVADNSDMNKKTVAKYWSSFQDFITGLNEANREEIKRFKERNSKVDKSPTDEELNQLVEDMDVTTLQEDALVQLPQLEFIIDDEDLDFINLYT